MLESIGEFFRFLTNRDNTKWYAFSILDYVVLVITGVEWLVTGESCIGFWLFIVVMNSLSTYFHNKNK